MRSKYDSDEAFQQALEKVKRELQAFVETEEGRHLMMNLKSYPLEMAADGSFSSKAIPPGHYRIDLNPKLWESSGGLNSRLSRIGMGSKMFDMPEVPGGYTQEPLDIGEVEVEILSVVKVGRKAPDFEVLDAEGRPLRLSDFRGKYVFLDFWSTTCGPCIAELPALREAHEAFKDHPDFVMIGLSLDEDWKSIQRFNRKEPMPWKQGRVGSFRTSKILEDYGVYGIPAGFLISPKGILLRKGMRGGQVLDTIKSYLP